MYPRIKTISQWLGTGSINLFGRPFAGKDTQGRMLATQLGGVLIGGGDILRSHKDPKEIEQILAAGGLIPHDYYLNMVLPYLSRAKFSGKPLVLDAVGRAKGEEQAVVKAAEQSGHPLKAVIVLQLSEQEVWHRFDAAAAVGDRGSRTDDSREVLKNRLKKYDDNTLPVLEYYKSNGLLIEVDGIGTRDEVAEAILDALAKQAQQ